MESVNNVSTALDEKLIEKFSGQVITDISAGMSGVMTKIGYELGLYKAMMGEDGITAEKLAKKTNTLERYVQEWLNSQAAGGYVNYDPVKKEYSLPLEHAFVLAVEESPAFLTPSFDVVSSGWFDKDKLVEAFKTGNGIGWHEHNHNLFFGTEGFYKTGYKANLVNVWIPALDGIDKKLKAGGKGADIGCGHGASTIILAEKYPNSMFYGYDYHEDSIKVARQRAKEAGLTNVFFEQYSADNFPGEDYDLICFMDAFHDLGNPLKAVELSRTKLAENGSLMLVEPAASDNPEENFHPVGRLFYSASTMFCVPNSHSQDGNYSLGAQAGPAKTEEIISKAGYSNFRIASSTPVNFIYEAKK
jgi:SAM-dependent methyltransferase